MSDDKKRTSTSGLTTGGLGAVLTTLVPALIPDKESLWRPVLYALAPLVSGVFTYLMSWVISRYGFESPAEASLRNSLQRDLKGIDLHLESTNLTAEFREELMRDRERTVRKILNIGKTFQVLPANPSENEQKPE